MNLHRKSHPRVKHGFRKYLIENFRLYLPTGMRRKRPYLIGDTGMNIGLAKKILPGIQIIELDQFINFLEEYNQGFI